MWPVLFSIGPYNVYAFGLFLALSFLSSTFLVWRYAREEFREEEYLDAYVAMCMSALIGARLTYVFLHLSEFGLHMLMYVVVRRAPGLSLLGGIVFALVFYMSFAKKRKFPRLHVLDIFSIAGSFALVCAKIGEQLGGAGFGKPTQGIFSVRLIGLPGRYTPVELYEAGAFLLLFVLLSFLYDRRKKYRIQDGGIATLFGFGTLLILFSLEFLKTYDVYFGGLSVRQYGCLLGVGFLSYPLIRYIIDMKKK